METTEKNIETYKEILDRFVVPRDQFGRDWMYEPICNENKCIATNAHALVAVPFFPNEYDQKDVSQVYPINHTVDKLILLSEIKEKFLLCPKIDIFNEIEKNCECCDGEGTVEYEYYFKKTYYTEHECPVCDGDGVITAQSEYPSGKQEYDQDKVMKIGNSLYLSDRVEELIFLAEKINSEIRIVNEGGFRGTLFSIGEVELLLMPCHNSKVDDIYATIDIKEKS